MWKALASGQGEKPISETSDLRRAAKRSKRLIYFFVDGKLHKVLAINKGADLLWAYSFADCERRMYSLSTVKRTMQRAYKLSEVAKMLGMHPISIKRAIERGDIERPQRSWNIVDDTYKDIRYAYQMSEDEVYKTHDFFSTYHMGRPRKDGWATRKGLITRKDLRALMNNGTIMYMETDDGTMIPVWKEQIL